VGWRYLAGSVVSHVAIMAVVFLVIPTSRPQALPRTIPVSLVSVPRGTATQAVVPAQPKRESKPKMKPDKTPNKPLDKVVKLPQGEEEKPQPVETPAPREEQEAGAEPVGVPGLSAGVAVDDINFEFTYYLISLRNRIGQNWSPPAGMRRGNEPVRVTVYFRIRRDGRVVEPQVEKSSGIRFFDQSAVRAVRVSSPVPPLPMGYAEDELGVHFAFEFEGR
jgi:TonB family protein